MKIAFLGLGVMGYPTAGHLANAGHEVTVYNRTVRRGARDAPDVRRRPNDVILCLARCEACATALEQCASQRCAKALLKSSGTLINRRQTAHQRV